MYKTHSVERGWEAVHSLENPTVPLCSLFSLDWYSVVCLFAVNFFFL